MTFEEHRKITELALKEYSADVLVEALSNCSKNTQEEVADELDKIL